MRDYREQTSFSKKYEEPVESSADRRILDAKTKKGKISSINLVGVHEEASAESTLVGYVRNGDDVEILSSAGMYEKIQFTDLKGASTKVGYISSIFCKEV